MRNTLLDPFEDLPRAVVVTANDYAAGSVFPDHAHRRGQFAFASRGTISLTTPEGRWLVPPQRACWVPAGVPHAMAMRGPVTMLNVFVAAEEVAAARLPARCGVHAVSALLRHLMDDAVDLPAMYDQDGRAGRLMQLLVAEIAVMPRLSLHAPLPRDPRLARACQQVFDAPSIASTLDAVAAEAGMSRRTFTRQFRADTGWGLPNGASRSACSPRSNAWVPGSRSPGWRWTSDTPAPARFRRRSGVQWGNRPAAIWRPGGRRRNRTANR